MTPTIRRADVPDLPALRRLFVQLIAHGLDKFPSPYPTMDDQEFDNFTLAMYRQLTLNPKFACFVAEREGNVVGFLAGEIWKRDIGKPNTYGAPHYLFVDQAARGKGIAAALIQAGIAWLREEGVSHVELAAFAGDPQWQQHGFRPYLVKLWASTEAIGSYSASEKPTPVPPPAKARHPRKKKRPRVNGHDIQAEP